MAKGNIRLRTTGGHSNVPTRKCQTEAGATNIKAGEPLKLKSAGSPYVIPLADDEPVIGTTTDMVGIAASDSTHTVSADGTVDVYLPLTGLVYEAKAKTAANVDTQAKIDAFVGDRKRIDLTGSTYTVDDATADAAANGVHIVGGDPKQKTLYFTLDAAATFLG